MANDYSENPYMGKVHQTGENEFEADKTIIKTLDAGRSIYNKLRANHLKRINLYREIEGLIQGNPPYNPSELAAAGLSHVSNFNDMSARAVFERACLAYWNLLNNAESLTRFVIRTKDPEAPYYADLLATNWDYAVRTHWKSFIVNVASLTAQIVKFGASPALFPDERDPRWRVIELSKFFIPDQAQADLDMLTTACVESEFTIQYLWSVYEEFKDRQKDKDGRAGGWNLSELARMLISVSSLPTRDSVSADDMMELERKLYSGDISFDKLYNDTIKVVSLLQREYSGKVSHYMFHRHFTANSSYTNTPEDFLFFEQDQYENMQEALVIFTMNPGEYTIHANRGLGHKIFSLAQAKIMLDCSVVDMAKWASTPILKSSSLGTKDMDQIRFYPGVPTNIGTAEFVQNNLGANVQNVVSAAQYLSNLIQFNITYSGSDPATPDPDKGSISPSQVRLMAFREFSILKNNIAHFQSTFDVLVQNMTAKMLRSKPGYPGYEIAECWKDRCVEDGVPEQVFELGEDEDNYGMPKHLNVYATRVAGAGSQVAHLIGLQELQAIVGSFGPREEKEFKRQFIMATLGPEYVESFMQESDDVDEQSGGASLAGVENAIMQAGKSPVFSMDNEHRSHFATHMALAKSTIDAIQQQKMDVIQADSVFSVLVPHLEDHINALQKSVFAADFYEKSKPMYDQVSRYAALNRKNAEKAVQAQMKQQQEQQANTQRVMSDEELKNLTTLNDEKRKDIKLEAQNQRQQRAGAVKEHALLRKNEGELAIKAAKVKGEVDIKKAETFLKNQATQDASENPHGYLTEMEGETAAPGDIENNGKSVRI